MNIDQPENNFLNFIKANRKIFSYLTIFLILIITFFSWNFYSLQKENIRVSDNFIRAEVLLSNQKEKEAKDILLDIINKKNTIYSSLSLFLLIENNLESNKEVILRYFDKIIENNSYSKEDRNLLALKKAIYISDIKNEQEILNLLNPIINSESVWKMHSLKFLGDFYFSINQFEKAKQYYSIILEEDNFSDIDVKRKIDLIKNE